MNIKITSYNRLVLLMGVVPNTAVREEIGRIARGIANVRGVYNELQVVGFGTPSDDSSDTYIATLTQARLVRSGSPSAEHIHAFTNKTVVYLLGLVKRSEADFASDIARRTRGVSLVVRLFEYLD